MNGRGYACLNYDHMATDPTLPSWNLIGWLLGRIEPSYVRLSYIEPCKNPEINKTIESFIDVICDKGSLKLIQLVKSASFIFSNPANTVSFYHFQLV